MRQSTAPAPFSNREAHRVSGFGPAGPPPANAIPGWEHIRTGKVRDLYRNDAGQILMVASDRISAFDWVLPTPIPNKGVVLTQLSLWWFKQIADIVPNHVISTDVPQEVNKRAVICEELTMFPVECVVRGYLTGSGLVEYIESGTVCGIALPPGLVDGSELPEPIFTPAMKAEVGEHDENVSFDRVVDLIGIEDANTLRTLSIAIYKRAESIAKERGIILADTKFEFGRNSAGVITLGDEVLTPDSSRFWQLTEWKPGQAQPSYDKQFLRDWLAKSEWDKNGELPPPELSRVVIAETQSKYSESYLRITGKMF